MPTYKVAIDVKKIYHVVLDAKDREEAIEKAESMQTTEVSEQGTLIDVESYFIMIVEQWEKQP